MTHGSPLVLQDVAKDNASEDFKDELLRLCTHDWTPEHARSAVCMLVKLFALHEKDQKPVAVDDIAMNEDKKEEEGSEEAPDDDDNYFIMEDSEDDDGEEDFNEDEDA